MAPRDYARLSWKWHRDKVLRAVNRQAPGALQLWPVLIALSKEQSDATDNPRGVIESTWDDLAEEAMLTVDQVERAVELLSGDAEMVQVTVGRMGVVHVELLRFDRYQVPRSSKAEQQQLRRDREGASREKGVERGSGVASASAPFTETETVDLDQALSSPPPAATPRKRKPTEPDEAVVRCFDWYCQLWQKEGALALTLTTKRRRAIEAALKEHGAQKVSQVIRGHHRNPWRHEKGLAGNDVAVLLRPENIDVGMEWWAKGNGSAPAAAAGAVHDSRAEVEAMMQGAW